MAFLKIENVAIRGISACVPEHVEENIDLPVFKEGEAERVIAQTGIERKHTIGNANITTADLCEKACNVLIEELGWERDSIDALMYVASEGDYIMPPTSCILQDKLGLSEECLTIDERQGCPGWVIGLSSLSALVATGSIKRALLLNGDICTILNSRLDKETAPLFGDAGAVTAIEYDENADPMYFYHGTRGKEFKAIHIPEGGHRNPLTPESLEYIEYGENQKRKGIQCVMDGMSVFGFGMNMGTKAVNNLCEKFSINMDNVDYFLFHQANRYMNDKIRKKLKLNPERVPFSMKDFGNTSNASIPLTAVTQCRSQLENNKLNIIGCAFGVGLAGASVYFKANNIVCPELVLYKN